MLFVLVVGSGLPLSQHDGKGCMAVWQNGIDTDTAHSPLGLRGTFGPQFLIALLVFGWGVIYALHARFRIERGRVWQAEHYVGAVRDRSIATALMVWRHTAVCPYPEGNRFVP